MTLSATVRGLLDAFCGLFLLQGLAACGTTAGFGRDLQDLGQNIEAEAQG